MYRFVLCSFVSTLRFFLAHVSIPSDIIIPAGYLEAVTNYTQLQISIFCGKIHQGLTTLSLQIQQWQCVDWMLSTDWSENHTGESSWSDMKKNWEVRQINSVRKILCINTPDTEGDLHVVSTLLVTSCSELLSSGLPFLSCHFITSHFEDVCRFPFNFSLFADCHFFASIPFSKLNSYPLTFRGLNSVDLNILGYLNSNELISHDDDLAWRPISSIYLLTNLDPIKVEWSTNR